MKKISFIVVALCAGCASFSQNTQPQLRTPMAVTTRFGVRAGVNLADLTAKNLPSGSAFTEAQSRTAYVVGAFANIPLAGMFRFQPEADFSSQGGKLQGPSGTTSAGTFEQVLRYVNVPLNFQLMTTKGFFVQAGPQLSYLIDAKAKNSSGTTTSNTDNKDAFDKFDFGVTGGVGYLSRIGLGVEARYNWGLANTIADDATNSYKGGTWKNQVTQISLIYQFGAAK